MQHPLTDEVKRSLGARVNDVGIIFNPISGKGRAEETARQIEEACDGCGITVRCRESERKYDHDQLLQFISQNDLLLISGGDGTVGPLLPALAESKKPFYMLPGGNESLAARHFCMGRDIESVASAIAAWRVEPHFFGFAGNTPFLSMASVGFDSHIVALSHEERNSPIGRAGYVMPVLKAAVSPAPCLTIAVDGTTVVEGAPGYFVAANLPQYALRLNPVPEAAGQSPDLIGRFFPGRGFSPALRALLRRLSGGALSLGNRSWRGKRFSVKVSGPPFPVQTDGDIAGATPVEIRSSEVPVMVLRGAC